MKSKSSIRPKLHSAGRQPKGTKAASRRNSPARRRAPQQGKGVVAFPDEQWLQEMRRMIRAISRQVDELELIFRAMEVLETKQAVRRWFNEVVPALGVRPIDLCQTARGRRSVLRELGRIEHGVHS